MKIGVFLLTGLLVSFAAAFAQGQGSGFGDMNQVLVFTPGTGLLFPVGDFDDNNDFGFSVGSGLEYFVSPRLALLANYSYLSFTDPSLSASGESFHFLGLGARGFLFRDARLNPYLRVSGGLYQASGGSKAGVNGGPGILYRLSKGVGLWAEGNAHFIFDYGSSASSSTANFLGVSTGLAFALPTGKKSQAITRKADEPPLTVVKEEKREEPGALSPAAGEEVLSPVHFDFDRYDLRADARAVLEKNLAVLQQNPGWKIELEGHCDEIGTEEYNISLGWKRADAVRGFLVRSGMDAFRLVEISYGKMRPVFLGLDSAARAKNRRVEFKMISR